MASFCEVQRAWPSVVPELLILGQITVDDTVPAQPGLWQRRLGGNALYAAAGARLWCSPDRIGVVSRASTRLPFDVAAILHGAGFAADGLVPIDVEPMTEWVMYEEDGNRQSMPRYAPLRDPAATLEELFQRYLQHLEALSPAAEDIPAAWLGAKAIHLAPQVLRRHAQSCAMLASETSFLSIDPSPHYSRAREAAELVSMLPGTKAFLPSQAEIQHLAAQYPDWPTVVSSLRHAGFPEVVLKQGAAGALLACDGEIIPIPPAAAKPVDLTGAGDAFSGAYTASRALGWLPIEAAAR